MKHSVGVELEAFNRNITALAAMNRRTAAQAVREAAVMILQSGANIMPEFPQNGPKSKKYRDVIRFVRRYRHGVEELVRDGRIEAPGDKYLWMIRRPRNRRPIARSGDRRWWIFETKEAAMAHRAVTYKGVAKAGFWSQLPLFGKAVPGKYARRGSLASIPGLTTTSIADGIMNPSVTVVNRSTAIGSSYAQSKRQLILSTVNNRIAGMTKRGEQYLARFREAGGVAWNEEVGRYE